MVQKSSLFRAALIAAALSQTTLGQQVPERSIDPRADRILRTMSAYLAEIEAFGSVIHG